MFRQTLGGATRNWFDDLDPKSVNSFEELSQKFLEEFSQQKRYAKDPTEIHGIKRRQNKGLQAFMDRFKSKSSHIKGVPLVLRISTFMHGHGHPKLAKKLNDKIPKTVDEMFEKVRAFIRGEVGPGSAEMGSQHQRLLSIKKVNGGSCGLDKVGPSGERYPPNQSNERKLRKEQCEGHKHDKRRRKSQKVIKSKGSLSTVEFHQGSCMNIASETSMSTSGQNSEDVELRCRLQIVIDKSSAGKHGCIRMGRIRKNSCSTICHGESTKDPFAEPVVHKRRPMTPDGILILKENMFRWLKEGMIRKPQQSLCQGHVPLFGGRGMASIDNRISLQMFPMTSEGIQPNKDDKGRQRKDWVSYGGRSILFHPYAERIKELSCYTSEDDGGGLSR
ncbi:reverse transcriptase domain-containing protein [Tanacetum coccineum]